MMKSRMLSDKAGKTWAVVFDTGDEAVSGLLRFAEEKQLGGSHFTAIGGLQDAVLGYFQIDKKDYKRIAVKEQVEVLSLIGDITLEDGQPKLHAHVVVGTSSGEARGGHLIEAHVRPTLEVILTESPQHLRREYNEDAGLALIRI